MKKAMGFTLVELMTTLAMVAVTLAIGIPMYRDMARSNQMTTRTNLMSSLLNAARSAAVTRGANVTVCPRNAAGNACGADWGNGLLVFVDADRSGSLDNAETVLNVSPFYEFEKTRISVDSGGVPLIVYNAAGAITGPNAVTLKLCDAVRHNSKSLSISLTGRVSVSSSNSC